MIKLLSLLALLTLSFLLVSCGNNEIVGGTAVEVKTVEEVLGPVADSLPEEVPAVAEAVEPVEEVPLVTIVDEIVVETPIEGVSETKIVNLIEGGFAVNQITINVGDTVEWKNVREGRVNKALVIGVRECRALKSSMFYTGESYEYTFTQPGTCTVVDGIYDTQTMKIFIE